MFVSQLLRAELTTAQGSGNNPITAELFSKDEPLRHHLSKWDICNVRGTDGEDGGDGDRPAWAAMQYGEQDSWHTFNITAS